MFQVQTTRYHALESTEKSERQGENIILMITEMLSPITG